MREQIVAVARSYIGTRFLHMGRSPGIGLDCVGVLVCVCRELGLVAPDFDVPPYTMNSSKHFIEWCDRYMVRVEQDDMQVGDALAMITAEDPQHLGILAPYRPGVFSLIHSSNRLEYMKVVEMRLMFSRIQKFAAAYRLPGVA